MTGGDDPDESQTKHAKAQESPTFRTGRKSNRLRIQPFTGSPFTNQHDINYNKQIQTKQQLISNS